MRGSKSSDLLFFGQVDSHDVRQHQHQELKKDVDQYSSQKLLGSNPEELAAYFSDKYSVSVPQLLTDEMTASQDEAQIGINWEAVTSPHLDNALSSLNGGYINEWRCLKFGSRQQAGSAAETQVQAVSTRYQMLRSHI